jgi:3-phosphoshikimate 1-carboxyvinyltransferase
VSSFGDHRIAMAFAIAGLFAEGETIIEEIDCVATSYPDFYQTLEKFSQIQPGPPLTHVISSIPLRP